MAGLLGSFTGKIGGLLGDPALKDAFWLTLASGADPQRADQLREEKRLSLDDERKRQYLDLQMQQAQIAAEQARQAQARQQYTQGVLGSNLSPEVINSPAFQMAMRQQAAAHGDISTLEQGGILNPLPTSTELPADARLYEWAKGDPSKQAFLNRNGQQQAPANLQEWAAYQRMSPEERAQYLDMKRSGYGFNAGNVPMYRTPGGEVTPLETPETVQARLAAQAAAEAAARAQGAKAGERANQAPEMATTLNELEEISADGGLIDQSTGSTLGAARDYVASAAGVSTPGAQAIARLAPIADRVLKTVPRFEGPQSDKDTQSYREAAGQLANPRIPAETRKAAAREIARLMRERQGQFETSGGLIGTPIPGSRSQSQSGRLRYNPTTGEFE